MVITEKEKHPLSESIMTIPYLSPGPDQLSVATLFLSLVPVTAFKALGRRSAGRRPVGSALPHLYALGQ